MDGREGPMGMSGVDKIGEIRRAYFEQGRAIKEILRTLSVSASDGAQIIRGTRPSSITRGRFSRAEAREWSRF